jgi:hypothetical protein
MHCTVHCCTMHCTTHCTMQRTMHHALHHAVHRALHHAVHHAVHHAMQVEDAHAMAWAWVVARQLLLLFESDVVVARAALGCERASDAEADAALAEALLDGARVALDRLGRGGDTTKRVLGGGVANRFSGRLKPIASFLDASGASGSSRWLRGALPRQVLRRAKLTETAMRLAVLGLTADAERFTLDAS